MLPKEEAKSREVETFIVTAYTNSVEDTGKRPGDKDYGITASGKRVGLGDCACDKRYPFGTKFYVPELGKTFTCVDRGSMVRGEHIDVYLPSRSSVKRFGRQRLEVEIKR
jgi:3D (Asp-Asp-Asp) domain-containing protein